MSEYARFQDDQNALYSTSYTTPWDADKIAGCVCDSTSFGPHCEYFKCPSGDDPMTTGQANEIQEIYCSCGGTCSGSFRLKFRGKTTKVSISHDASASDLETALENIHTIGNVEVTYVGGASTLCSASGTVATVEFLSESGNLPPLRIMRSTVSSSTSALTFEVGDGGVGGTGSSSDGTKENEMCNGRGFCDVLTGSCTCEAGFESSDGEGNQGSRGDCGYTASPGSITECPYGRSLAGRELPYDTECSGHGHCSGSPSFACACFEGWTGHDCGQRVCPFGIAWFDEATDTDTAHAMAECSNRGVCDTFFGTCTCDPGFEGAACERMKCHSDCNGQGDCMTLAEIAATAGTTYGSDPNAMATWDAHKVTGCVCDAYKYAYEGDGARGDVPDYFGYDCSLRTCPHGNPMSNADGSVNEEQRITCVDGGGGDAAVDGFVFTFDGETSATTILSSAPATREDSGGTGTSVEEILEAMTTIDDVEVEFVSPVGATTACSSAPGTVISIKYFTNLGDLALADVATAPGSVAITVGIAGHVDGTKQSVECAGAGICDRSTGRCRCFRNMVSSNANNQQGRVGDCGAFELRYTGR